MITAIILLTAGYYICFPSLAFEQLFGAVNWVERKINEFKHFLKVTDRYFKIHKR